MDSELKPREPVSIEEVHPLPIGDRPPSRGIALPWLLVIALLGAVAWLGWRAFGSDPAGDPVSTSLVALEQQNRLTVFSAELSPVVASEDSRYLGTLNSRQVAVIPARVDYAIDLSQLGRQRMVWDEVRQQLDVTLPPLDISRPNLDEARAQYLREGIWITREAQDKLTRDNTRAAERQAREQARNPVLLDLARSAAKAAIQQNLAVPLEVAGFGNVKVNVRFEDE